MGQTTCKIVTWATTQAKQSYDYEIHIISYHIKYIISCPYVCYFLHIILYILNISIQNIYFIFTIVSIVIYVFPENISLYFDF